MAIYLAFTAFAIIGYLTFGLHPELLAGRPALTAFYGQAFTFFAQGHVWIGAAVMGLYLVRHAGMGWLPAFGAIYLVSFLSEFIGTGYGLPFGPYHYTDLLGAKWFGRVPILIPLSWFLMALPAYVVVRHRLPSGKEISRIAIAAALFVIWDLSLDPAMSHLTSYWVWGEEGMYYGMPLLNLVGWMITALVLMTLMEVFAGAWIERLSERWMAVYYGVTLLMPMGMAAAAGLWLPVALTLGGLAACGALLVRGAKRGDGPENAPPEQDEETAPLLRLVEDANASTIFEHHARSFSFAARCFPCKERRLVACLYAFCRTTDDLVDCAEGSTPEEVKEQLEAWRTLARRAYAGEASGIPWLDEIMTASARAGVPPKLIDELVAGVRMDLGRVDVQTVAELDAYAYRVASVVGIWMCHLAGVRDADTLKQAAAMGRAMQLTNILRDVGEDLEDGRLYLPARMRVRYGVTEDDLHEMRQTGTITPEYRRLVEALMARAEAEYARAFPGLAALPPSYARASAVAAEIYRGIHRQIRRSGYDNLHRRAYTGRLQKVRLALRGLMRLWRCRRSASITDFYRAVKAAKGRWADRLYRIGRRWMLVALCAASVAAYAYSDAAAQSPEAMELGTLRSRYVKAVENEDTLDRTLEALADHARGNPVEKAYTAALTVLRAKHAFWPHVKLRHLRAGLPSLDRLVAQCPSQVEVRYLRLLSCYFLPDLLGRTDSVRKDFAALARLLPEVRTEYPPRLYRNMVRFVLERGKPSRKARSHLQAALQAAGSAAEAAREAHL